MNLNHQKMIFPDGFECYYVSSQEETRYIYNEVFTEQQYIQNGIVVNEGDCIFDVGANIGMFSMFVNQLKPNLKTYAFEPIPSTFEVLKSNVELHSLKDNLFVFNYGISADDNTEKVFTFYPQMAGNSTSKPLEKFVNLQKNESSDVDEGDLFKDFFTQVEDIKCKLRTLSSVIEELRIECIDLLKIDVEGEEYEVLQGIKSQDWKKINQVVAEVHDQSGKLDKIKTILTEQSFKVKTQKIEFLPSNFVDVYNLYAVRNF